MSEVIDDLRALSARLEDVVFGEGATDAERDAAAPLLDAVAKKLKTEAIAQFRGGTAAFIDLAGLLDRTTAGLGGPATPRLAAIRDEIHRLHALVHDPEGMRTTWTNRDEFEETFKDEDELPPAAAPAVEVPPPPQGLSALTAPTPVDARAFPALEDEYLRFYAGAQFRSAAARASAQDFARTALRNRARYEDVAGTIGAPWWFVAAIHLLESTFNFGTHLHNGDSLKGRTFRVPAGRPRTGSPPFTWEESARDAMTAEFAGARDWSLARCLFRWEAYNGFGYRRKRVPTPYLWSFTTIYEKGKFVGDGVFSPTAVSKQCGAAALLRALAEMGEAAPKVEPRDEGEDGGDETPAGAALLAGGAPAVDAAPATNVDFRSFFETRLRDLKHFTWDEFLVKGASHARNGLNTDPPRDMWENVVPLARVLDHFRERIGHPVRLTSVYRSPAYNDAVGGERASRHMMFDAADLVVEGAGSARDWAAALRALRAEGLFSGGIGLYVRLNFVHVDTRGVNRDWTGKGD